MVQTPRMLNKRLTALMAINNFKININSVDNYIHKNKKCTSTRMPTVILPRCKLLTRRQYTCMQARTGGVNVYYGNARNCRLMPLACSRNQPSVGSRQVVSLSLSLSLSLSHTHTHTHTPGMRFPQFGPKNA